MGKLTLFAVLLVAGFLLFGCSQGPSQGTQGTGNNPEVTTPPAANQPAATPPAATPPKAEPSPSTPPANQPSPGASSEISAGSVFKYGSVNSYEYRVIANGKTVSTMKTTITPDSVDGVAAWLQKTETIMEGQTSSVISKMWIDKTTLKCLKLASVFNIGGEPKETVVPCTSSTSGASSGGEKEQKLKMVDKGSATVPAGTFECTKYSVESAGETAFYWISASVPVPVKMSTGVVSIELVSYS